jgi:toxin CcdB
MARFDVHRLVGSRGYVLDVQADHLAALPSRIVVPLRPPGPGLPPIGDLNPVLAVDGRDHAMMTHYLTAVPRKDLGAPVASVAAQRDAVTRALDLLFTGF